MTNGSVDVVVGANSSKAATAGSTTIGVDSRASTLLVDTPSDAGILAEILVLLGVAMIGVDSRASTLLVDTPSDAGYCSWVRQ